MNISNTTPRSRLNPSPAANDNAALPQAAARQPPVSGNQQPSGTQASRAAEAARNRLIGDHPPVIRAELRRYLVAVRKNQTSAIAFYNLGKKMTATEHFDVNGVSLSKQQCYCKAVELDRQYARAFNSLGNTLSANGSINVNGTPMTKQQCYLKAAELDSEDATAFNNLGTTLSTSRSIDVNGAPMTRQQCFHRAAELDLTNSFAFNNLGTTLSARERIEVNGVPMTGQQCYLKSIELSPQNEKAFSNLGASLSTRGSIDVNGAPMTKQQCYLKVIQLDPENANAFRILGTTLSARESINVNGMPMTRQQCYRKAAELEPRNPGAFRALGTTLRGAITTAANTIGRRNRHRAPDVQQRQPDQSHRVELRNDAPVVPAPAAAQRGSDTAQPSRIAARFSGGIDPGADTDLENIDLPLNADELAEALQLQQQSDARRPVTAANDASAASPMLNELSSLVVPSAPPWSPRAAAWAAAPATLVKQDWRFAPTDELADSFNTFQARLDETADYRSELLRPGLIGRVNELVTTMRESPELRRTCFAIAQGAILRCGDAITLGLNQMSLAKIDHDAQVGGGDVNQLHALGEGFFRLHVLNGLVDAEISRRRAAGISMDEVEIRLAYQVALRSRLDLPGVAHAMRFVRSAHVTQEAIDAAGAEVERRAQGSASVEYLVQWTPWQQLMERTNPQAYAAVRRLHQDDRDAIALQPPRTTEAEWLGTLSAQTAREKTDIERVTRRLTWAILEENLEPS